MTRWLERAKPTEDEVRRLALRETDQRQWRSFEPIARGPVFALIALTLVLLAALPFVAFRVVRGRREAG